MRTHALYNAHFNESFFCILKTQITETNHLLKELGHTFAIKFPKQQ